MMLQTLSRNWWIFAVRGIAAIVFGVLAFVSPGATLGVLVLFFGAYAIVDGASLLFGVATHGQDYMRYRWALAIAGVLGIVTGVITFVWPALTALTLLYVVAGWAIAMGVLQMVAAVHLRREIEGEWWLALGGALTALFGIYLAVLPGDGLLTLVWLVGAWAVVFGVFSLMLAWRVRSLHTPTTASAA